MNQMLLFNLATRNTFKKKLRVILAVSGIALTSGVMVMLLGVQGGLKNLIKEEIKNGQALDAITITGRSAQDIKLNQAKISEIKSISTVSDVSESVGLYGSASYHGIVLNTPAYAVSQTHFAMNPASASIGSVSNQPNEDSVVVSNKVLETFGIDRQRAVGKVIKLTVQIPKTYASSSSQESETIFEREYVIRGVIDRGNLPVFYINIEPLKEHGLTSVSQLFARLTTADKAEQTREAVERHGLQTASVQDTIKEINQLFDVIQNILVVFGIIVFIIAVSSAFTIITLTLMEETKQIGLLRIMGLRHQETIRLFILQSILVTTMGALAGCIAGLIGGFALNGYARILAEDSTFSGRVSVFLAPVIPVIIILVLSVAVGWLIGAISAKKATMINPLKEILS